MASCYYDTEFPLLTFLHCRGFQGMCLDRHGDGYRFTLRFYPGSLVCFVDNTRNKIGEFTPAPGKVYTAKDVKWV